MINEKTPTLKQQAMWNAAAGILCALESVIMTIVSSHVIDMTATGELTIAFALGNLIRTIGLWGTRNYHLSDLKYEFSFKDYRKARLINMVMMALVVLLYVIISASILHASVHKIIVIVVIEGVYWVECYEDLIGGEYQRRGRLDIGSKLFLIRWGSLLITYTICVFLTRNLIPALFFSLIISIVAFCLSIKIVFKVPQSNPLIKTNDRKRDGTRKLLKTTFPLFMISFLMFFLNNVAKYSLDLYYDATIQGIFGILALSIFAVEVLSAFLYQPRLTLITAYWLEKKKNMFLKEIFRQTVIIIILSIVCIVGGWLVGILILSMLFSVDLSRYKYDLILNILAGSAMAFAMFAGALLTIMRKQNLQLFIYGISAIIGGVVIWFAVKYYGIRGGSWGNLSIFVFQAVSMFVAVFVVLNRGSKLRKKI